MSKTKIISTLGPASDSDRIIENLIRSGTDVFRLNMSHAKQDWVRDMALKIRSIADSVDHTVGLLMDLQGPSIRTGELSEPLELKKDDKCELRLGNAEPAMHQEKAGLVRSLR